MGQSYRPVQTLRSVGETHPHVTTCAPQEIRYALRIPAHNRNTLTDVGQGTVVRLAPNLLSTSDPRMLPIIYHRYADKGEFYTHGVMGERAPTFQTLSHHEHAVRRRIITPGVHQTTAWIRTSRLWCGN